MRGNLSVVNQLSDTRWSARADAVKALTNAYKEHVDLSQELATDKNETVECRRDASVVHGQMNKLDTSIMLVMWNIILERIQKTNEALQKKGLALNTTVELLHSLKAFIADLRDRFDEVDEKGMKNCSRKTYEEETRQVRKMYQQLIYRHRGTTLE